MDYGCQQQYVQVLEQLIRAMAMSELATFLEALAVADEQTGEAIRQAIARASGCEVPGQEQDSPAARSGCFLAEVYQFVDNEGIKT
eukprot:13697084-Heterocapsa_arctica.AAC.1